MQVWARSVKSTSNIGHYFDFYPAKATAECGQKAEKTHLRPASSKTSKCRTCQMMIDLNSNEGTDNVQSH